MNKVTNEFRVACDVDNTLIMHNYSHDNSILKIAITNPNDGTVYQVAPHAEHVALLRQYKARGMYITVWSNNGVDWAEAVVKALDLEAYVDEVATKYIKHMDDQDDVLHIAGASVYIPFVPKPIYCVPFQSGGQGGGHSGGHGGIWGNGQQTYYVKGNS